MLADMGLPGLPRAQLVKKDQFDALRSEHGRESGISVMDPIFRNNALARMLFMPR